MPRKRTGRTWCNSFRPLCATSRRTWRTSLETAIMALVGGGGRCGWGRSIYSAFPENCSVSYLSFVYGRSLWAELNGGENSLHWKANVLPLFTIMRLRLCDRQYNICVPVIMQKSCLDDIMNLFLNRMRTYI